MHTTDKEATEGICRSREIRCAAAIDQAHFHEDRDPVLMTDATERFLTRSGDIGISFNYNEVSVISGDPRFSSFALWVTSPEAILEGSKMKLSPRSGAAPFELQLVPETFSTEDDEMGGLGSDTRRERADKYKQSLPTVSVNKLVLLIPSSEVEYVNALFADDRDKPVIVGVEGFQLRNSWFIRDEASLKLANGAVSLLMREAGVNGSHFIPYRAIVPNPSYRDGTHLIREALFGAQEIRPIPDGGIHLVKRDSLCKFTNEELS